MDPRPTSPTSLENQTERRTFGRYPAGRDPVVIDTSSGGLEGTLVDESLGGVGVHIPARPDLAFGQQVVVTAHGCSTVGYICGLRRDDEGYRVSISWDGYTKVDGKRYRTVAHYIQYHGIPFVCELLYEDLPTLKSIRLWDGKRFRVHSDDVYSRSHDARRSELLVLDNQLETIAKLYRLPERASTNVMASILEFEFAFPSVPT